MRKTLWCCSAAGLLATGSFVSTALYACRNPESCVGRTFFAAAHTSLAMQPFSGLADLVANKSANADAPGNPGSAEECVPDEPHPILPETAEKRAVRMEDRNLDLKAEVAHADPIMIPQDDPMPEIHIMQSLTAEDNVSSKTEAKRDSACPIVMPYCEDDEVAPRTTKKMPYADDTDAKPAEKTKAGTEESEENVFKEWRKLFETKPDTNADSAEELPFPKEEGPSEPKCKESDDLSKQYPGCPHVTRPYVEKSSAARNTKRKWGNEESSEEPEMKKDSKEKEKTQRIPGVDTMEFRPSDRGLNEYGPGPIH